MNNTTFVTGKPFGYLPSVSLWLGVETITNVMGATASALLLFVIRYERRLRHSGSRWLIAHIVFVDLIMSLIHCPINNVSYYVAYASAPFPWIICAVTNYLLLVTLNAGLWSMALLALHRMLATYAPLFYNIISSTNAQVCLIVAGWTAGFALNGLHFAGIGGAFGWLPPWKGCGVVPNPQSPLNYMTFINMYLPLAIVVTCSVMVVLRMIFLKPLASTIAPMGAQAGSLSRARRKHIMLAKMMVASSVFYCMCYCPVTIPLNALLAALRRNPMLQLWVRLLIAIAYAGNPVIFFAVCSLYRQELVKIFNSLVGRKNLLVNNRTTEGSHSTMTKPALKLAQIRSTVPSE